MVRGCIKFALVLARAIGLTVVAALIGCSSHPATQVVVIIDASESVAAATARLNVQVITEEGEAVLDEDVGVGPGATLESFPASVPIVPRAKDAARRFTLIARAFDDTGAAIGMQRVLSGYVERELREIRIVFDDVCADQIAAIDESIPPAERDPCRDGLNCVDGWCLDACYAPQTIDSESLTLPNFCPAEEGVMSALERRCVELGTDCVCSEPLASGGLRGAMNRFDPEDSVGLTSCVSSDAPMAGPISGTAFIADPADVNVEVPAGDSLARVWAKVGSPGGLNGMDVVVDASTTCTRSYFRLAPDFTPSATLRPRIANFRTPDFDESNGASFGVEIDEEDQFVALFVTNDDAWEPLEVGAAPNPVTVADCRAAWCRVEMCVDATDETPSLRARVVELGGGATAEFGPVSLVAGDAAPAAPLVLRPLIIELHVPDVGSELGGAQKQTYFTHGMMARRTPPDPSFWIGSACEVEGGCEGE